MKTIHFHFCAVMLLISAIAQSQTISTGYISGSPFCRSAVISVPYTATGTFGSTNVFKAQLSSATGSFSAPTLIGSLTSRTSGTITATIPSGAAAGTLYRIRVISSSPAVTGSNNGTDLTILPATNCTTTWTTTGNGGISGTANFIGTLNDAPLVFKVNNRKSGFIENYTGNTGLGYGSLAFNTYGMQNTAIGFGAMEYFNGGYYNTSIGANSNRIFPSCLATTIIGCSADLDFMAQENATTLGYYSMVDNSNKVNLGNYSVWSIGGQVPWTSYSDGRIKKNVRENVPGLDFIRLLKPVTYNFDLNKQYELTGRYDTGNYKSKYDIEKISFSGFIAQDVDDAAKKANYDFSGVDKSGKLMGLRYSEFVVPLVKAVQEQQKIIEEYKESMEDMKKKFEAMESKLNNLLAGGNNSSPANSSLKMSPNPASGNTTLFLSNNRENVSIRITDEGGKLVWQSNTAANSIVIPCAKFTAGVYAVTVTGSKGSETTRLVLAK